MNWGSDQDWLELHNRLVLHAHRRCRKLGWRKRSRENLPGGYSPEAIANEAYLRWRDGTRNWDREKYPGDSPVNFLKGVVDSIISDHVRGAEHKLEVSLEGACEAGGGDEGNYHREVRADESSALTSPASSPEYYTLFREILRQIQVLISDDADLVSWYRYSCAGMKTCEIANTMGISVNKAYLLRRRFLRRVKEILDEWLGGDLSYAGR
jgi:DNA-directed RNA polymerase specialized sigma24 family protein